MSYTHGTIPTLPCKVVNLCSTIYTFQVHIRSAVHPQTLLIAFLSIMHLHFFCTFIAKCSCVYVLRLTFGLSMLMKLREHKKHICISYVIPLVYNDKTEYRLNHADMKR